MPSRHGLQVWFRKSKLTTSLAQRSRYSVKDAAASPQIHEVACLPLLVAGRPQRHSGPPQRTLPHQPVPCTASVRRGVLHRVERFTTHFSSMSPDTLQRPGEGALKAS